MADYLDGLADLPDRPMTLKELGTFYEGYQDDLLARFESGTKESALRTNKQKRIREGWHAYLFGAIYGALFGCRDILTIHVCEVADRDALIQWKNGNRIETVNLQLKELVSAKINRSSGGADADLQKQLDDLPAQYPNATDLTVAFYMNYGNVTMTSVSEPPKLNVGALWFFGFSKPNCEELFLVGGKGNEHNFRLTWRHI